MLVHAQGVLGLVDNAITGASVNVLVLAATELVRGRLSTGLLTVGNDSARDELVYGIAIKGDSLSMLTERSCRWCQ